MKYADLHLHTIYSDGLYQPKRVVKECAVSGLDVIAISDHDTTRGYKEAREEAKIREIEVITGVEITTKKYHILGYNFDIENKIIQEFLAHSRECQEENTRKRVKKLIGFGMPITFEKVKHHSPNSRLGKLNILYAMLKDEECRKYNIGKNPQDLMNIYFKKGGIAYNIEKRKNVSTEEAIHTIHDAGGISIIAHPFKEIENIDDMEQLVKKGIDGLEVQPHFGKKNEIFEEYAKKKGLLITYGSDNHGIEISDRTILRRGCNLIEEFWR